MLMYYQSCNEIVQYDVSSHEDSFMCVFASAKFPSFLCALFIMSFCLHKTIFKESMSAHSLPCSWINKNIYQKMIYKWRH